MFDIGFSEMVVLAVVALVVLGPERLPKVAKQTGAWMGKLRRYVDDVKSDINRQMELSELRNLKNQVTDAARELETSVQSTVSGMQSQFDDVQKSIEGGGATATTEPQTDWDRIYAVRRQRERIKDRRIEREKELGIKRPKRPFRR
ncbi:MAG TPA: Sec-independent protein translocase protein TatB [Burkholderiaceae bacterium]|nr:Sec-independent protein translocase protein TatB [Burkholderiaceae bacterium]